MSFEAVGLRLNKKRLMKQSKTVHGARVVASLGGIAVCHLREFGICDFEVVDRSPAELLVANTRDARGNPSAFRRKLWAEG